MVLKPAFEKNFCCIAVSCSEEYVPYLSVYLQSIKEHASNNYNYDVVVFERGISDDRKEQLQKFTECGNIVLRFVNPLSLIENCNLSFPAHYNLECYFRLVSPLILKEYKKILFTDVDLIFQQDPMILYKKDIKNYPLAACKDLMWGAMLNHKDARDWISYALNTLNLEKPYEYFNTGVMLLNVNIFNQKKYSKKLLELVSSTTFRILEQDGLNTFFKTDIYYLDTAWNYPVAYGRYIDLLSYMPEENMKQYLKDKNNPYIIHYAGESKPWCYPEEEKASIWWQYARKTPFYTEILSRFIQFRYQVAINKSDATKGIREEFIKVHFPNINSRFVNTEYRQHLLFVIDHINYFRLKKFIYSMLKLVLSKSNKEKYRQKCQVVSRILKDAKQLQKRMYGV